MHIYHSHRWVYMFFLCFICNKKKNTHLKSARGFSIDSGCVIPMKIVNRTRLNGEKTSVRLLFGVIPAYVKDLERLSPCWKKYSVYEFWILWYNVPDNKMRKVSSLVKPHVIDCKVRLVDTFSITRVVKPFFSVLLCDNRADNLASALCHIIHITSIVNPKLVSH